jgi:hypothetical protein
MHIYEHLSQFDGLPVAEFGDDDDEVNVLAPGGFAWGVRDHFEGEGFDKIFERFLAAVDTTAVTHLVLGYWGADFDDSLVDPVQLLVQAAPRLPALKAVFLGDIIVEEAEISWINQCDITPLLATFSDLERLEMRGGNNLVLSPVSASALKVLRFEAGGLPAAVVRAVGASTLPSLETLEMWLGVQNYGGDATVADLAGILGGERLPALRRLGLMNSEIQDEICAAVGTAPVVARLADLLLSMGVLTDEGAEALLSGQPLTHLRLLDLGHNYLTTPMISRLRATLPQARLESDGAEKDHEDERFVEVSE